ncbi:MAG TPA: VOC family protein [Chloroflexota bacterium]|nr:VOC family protein [Chloroflexota bacterium]
MPEVPSPPVTVVFRVDEARYETSIGARQIIHEALDRALPEELRQNHRMVFRAENGDTIYADHFAGDLQDAYANGEGPVLIDVEVTEISQPDAPGAPPFRNFGFDHLAIAVADRSAARDFFHEALGMQIVRDDPHQTVLTTGHTSLFMFDARPGIPLSDPDPSKWHHLGFVVDNLEAALWHIQASGHAVSSDFTLLERDERWSLYLHYQNGPVRLMIQISEIKPHERGFADPRRFADYLYDYSKGPYGAKIGK